MTEKRRDIVEYRTARQMGTLAKRLGISFKILHRSGEEGIAAGKVEVEVVASGREQMEAFDHAVSGATEADVGYEPERDAFAPLVASLALCKELYELSGEFDPYFDYWVNPHYNHGKPMVIRDASRDGASVVCDAEDRYYPAYDLGYLLRMLPPSTLNTGTKGWDIYIHSGKLIGAIGDTPENAACALAIELFKMGILERKV